MTEEPDALNVHVRICGGVVQQWAALPGTISTSNAKGLEMEHALASRL